MKQALFFWLIIVLLPLGLRAQQINGTWKYRSLTMVRQTDTIRFFHIDSLRNFYGLERVRITFKDSGRYEILAFDGNKTIGSWKIQQPALIVDADTNTLVQQTDTILLTQADIRTVDFGYDFSGVLITELVRLPACASITSLRSGDWYDPGVWSCNRVPDREDEVTIKAGHIITLSKQMGGHNCKKLTMETGAQFITGGKLDILR